MRARVDTIWQSVRASYWFVPVIMSLCAIGLSMLVIRLEAWLGTELVRSLGWVYSGGVDGARGVLTAIAGSVITVAGTTFSVTIASLSLASSQFGPRALRGFMRDRGNQFVLGTFTSTFLFCLLILRTIRGGEDGVYVPHLAVTTAVVLAVVCVGVLIYFIHHAAQSVQVSHIIEVAGSELDKSIERLFPERLGEAQEDGRTGLPEAAPGSVRAESQGYVAVIDAEALLGVATEFDVQIRIVAGPGEFVVYGDVLVQVWPDDNEDISGAVRSCFALTTERSPEQDAVFAFEQLAEIGVRALSPGINDPYTAVSVIDRLTASLNHLDRRDFPSERRSDADGRLRVVAPPSEMADYVEAALRTILDSAAGQPMVLEHLARRCEERAARARHEELRVELLKIKDRVDDIRRRD